MIFPGNKIEKRSAKSLGLFLCLGVIYFYAGCAWNCFVLRLPRASKRMSFSSSLDALSHSLTLGANRTKEQRARCDKIKVALFRRRRRRGGAKMGRGCCSFTTSHALLLFCSLGGRAAIQKLIPGCNVGRLLALEYFQLQPSARIN